MAVATAEETGFENDTGTHLRWVPGFYVIVEQLYSAERVGNDNFVDHTEGESDEALTEPSDDDADGLSLYIDSEFIPGTDPEVAEKAFLKKRFMSARQMREEISAQDTECGIKLSYYLLAVDHKLTDVELELMQDSFQSGGCGLPDGRVVRMFQSR